MPNWCRNRVTVYGNEEEVSKVVYIFESKDTVFGKIIPSPDWKNIPNEDGELPVVVEHKNPKTGEVSLVTTEFPKRKRNDDRWYEWNIANWGTKWNSCNTEIVDDTDNILSYRFETAWDCPREIAGALLRMKKTILKDIEISWDCIHEDGAEEETIIEKGVEYEFEETS